MKTLLTTGFCGASNFVDLILKDSTFYPRRTAVLLGFSKLVSFKTGLKGIGMSYQIELSSLNIIECH